MFRFETDAMRPRPGHQRRSGVLLLVVLCLLTLFVLVGLVFLQVASQYRRATQYLRRETDIPMEPKGLLNAALHQIIRDTDHPSSALFRNSLLLDKYGRQGTRVKVVRGYAHDGPVRFDASGLGDLRVDSLDVQAIDIVSLEGLDQSLGLPPDYWMGAEVTNISGADATCTSRILRYIPLASALDGTRVDRLYTLPFVGANSAILPVAGDTLLINDRPFDGTGAGYTGSDQLDGVAELDFGHISRLPLGFILNHGFHVRKLEGEVIAKLDERLNMGGLDEPYDAADFQNPFMACTITRPGGSSGAWTRKTLLPSFHRPDLVNYLATHMGMSLSGSADAFSEQQRNVLRAAILRPLAFDHPRFNLNPTHGNLSHPGLGFNPIDGPWDVDNDGDGERDSIWLDLGFAAEADSQGRWRKPLFAILIRDMDGRVNVNAAGNLAHRDPKIFNQPGDPDFPLAKKVMVEGKWVHLPRGLGTGPVEISLSTIFPGNDRWNPIDELVVSRYRSREQGPNAENQPGRVGNDFMTYLRTPGLPNTIRSWQTNGIVSEYLSTSDVYGRTAIWVDGGPSQPSHAQMGSTTLGESVDDPYELDLLHPNNADSPLAEWELETYLRRWDRDMSAYRSHGSRLSRCADQMAQDAAAEFLATTRSFDVPVPPASPPVRDQGNILACGPMVELFRSRLRSRGLSPVTIEAQIELLCPWELRRGEKFNLNRPWGNGYDDDTAGSPGFGVADDPGEFQRGEGAERIFAEIDVPAATQSGTRKMRWPSYPDGRTGEDPRLIFARQLYALAMFVKDDHVNFPIVREEPPLPPATQRTLTAQRLAQWAVNVVDFRDADMIMTGFEYDENPLNGWDVDGLLETIEDSPERHVVWGCELPVLLLSESLAFHDRRAADTPAFGSRDQDGNRDGQPDDEDLDQAQIPQGSLFLELYSPPSAGQHGPSGDLYIPSGELDLERRAPSGHPVWRIGITKPYQELEESSPDYLEPEQRMLAAPNTARFAPHAQDLERFIWFTHFGPSGPSQASQNTFYNRASTAARVSPGGYVIVGPRERTFLGNKKTNTQGNLPSDQSLTLEHRRDRDTGIEVRDLDRQLVSRKSATVIIAAANRPETWSSSGPPIGLSVSEPLIGPEYYDEPNARSAALRKTGFYETPVDCPLDSQSLATNRPDGTVSRLGDWCSDNGSLTPPRPSMLSTGLHRYIDRNGVERRWRTAYLQRLADPTRAWHPFANPYLTVDWISIDLSVFNGTSPQSVFKIADQSFALDPDDITGVPSPMAHSRERGVAGSKGRENLLWTYDSTAPEQTSELMDAASDENFQFVIRQSLGSRNRCFQLARQPYFPWLQWNNRPFVSELELLLVPSCSADRLCFEWKSNQQTNPYTQYANNMSYGDFRAVPFGHLLNFFHGDGLSSSSLSLWRFLDYIHVPSRFNGTKISLSSTMTDATNEMSGQHGIDGYWSPLHELSVLREPGKINLNTIFDGRVWNALAAGFPDHFQSDLSNVGFYDDFVLSRQGYLNRPSGSVQPYAFDAEYPTVFANPFRASSLSSLVPPLVSPAQWNTGVQSSLLRATTDERSIPVFSTPLSSDTAPHRDPKREPQFHFQGIQRLANLTTTRSNVFAIWITIGYFALEPKHNETSLPPESQHTVNSSGSTLGPEIGIDTGEEVRHRGFYLFDRSISVGFETGKNHNVDNAIILQRYIE